MKAIVNKIIPFSSVDGIGNRTAIFFQGCNFNCSYCHNKETINLCLHCGSCVKNCNSEALSFKDGVIKFNEENCTGCDSCIVNCPNSSTPKTKEYKVLELLEEIKKYAMFIDGITVSGGECTLWDRFLLTLFKEVKKEGLTALIDSNGFKSFKDMKELLDASDGVMLDVKAWDKSIHEREIGKDNHTVKENLNYLIKENKLREVRTVIVSKNFNNEETVREVSKIIGSLNKDIKYKLIRFRNHGVRESMKNVESPSLEYMNSLKIIAKNNGCKNIEVI